MMPAAQNLKGILVEIINRGFRTTDRNQMTAVSSTSVLNQPAGNHAHSLNIPPFSSNTSGSHNHQVSLSSGGSNAPATIIPSYLSTNVFIYLGE